MEKYSLEELEKVYNNLADVKNNIYTKNQKITLLNFLKKELKNISCLDYLGNVNCLYFALNCIDYKNPGIEKEYICDKLDLYSYFYEEDIAKEYKYSGCPFIVLENKVVKLIKELKSNEVTK